LANTEVKVDNASATYECCLSRDSLYNTLATHLLKIATVSRSHLGYTAVGDVSIDMSTITKTKPHSFRCPITGKSFKTMKDYSRHRQVMAALKTAGKISRSPPVEPILIKAVDLYLGLTAAGDIIDASGGKMRVLVVIEDLGMVGNEIGLNVRPGYSQHNGGVYSSIDHDRDYPEIDDEGLAITSNTHSVDPLDRTDLTSTQRSHLEALRVDWEGWRRAAEAQWKEALREKETQLRKKLEQEASASLSERADDLRRGHEEAGRLEVRLRAGNSYHYLFI
jgi:stress-induced morphogen